MFWLRTGIGVKKFVHPDDMAAGLVDIMSEEIDDGKTVRLGDFGLFRPSFVGKSADTEAGVSASNIVRKRILFFPGESF